jgi:hypothetical protein
MERRSLTSFLLTAAATATTQAPDRRAAAVNPAVSVP